jgi:hypothetical protein
VGLLHPHVPVDPGVLTEQTWPAGQPHGIVPPVPLSRPVPHLPAYAGLEQVSGAVHAPAPSLVPQTWFVHQQTREPVHVHVRAEPQPAVTGCFVSLHSPPAAPPPVQAGAGVQHVLTSHCVPVVHLLQLYVVPAARQESWIGPQVPEARLHESVRVQHDPTTPDAGAGPGLPVAFATHSSPVAHVALIV